MDFRFPIDSRGDQVLRVLVFHSVPRLRKETNRGNLKPIFDLVASSNKLDRALSIISQLMN